MCTGGRKESQLPPAVISTSQNQATQTGAHTPGPGALRSPCMNNIHQTRGQMSVPGNSAIEKVRKALPRKIPWTCWVHGHKHTFTSEAELVGKERKLFQANKETGVKTRVGGAGGEVAAPPPGPSPTPGTYACGFNNCTRAKDETLVP